MPGPPSLPWEQRNVPHGTIHRHFYRSAVVGDDRDFYVYTPPGYDAGARTPYPVLYLLHGFSDDASAWTAMGRAHVILDNLIAEGKARPMLVVMPLGYGAPGVVAAGPGASRPAALHQRNLEGCRDALLKESDTTRRSRRPAPTRGWSGGGTWPRSSLSCSRRAPPAADSSPLAIDRPVRRR